MCWRTHSVPLMLGVILLPVIVQRVVLKNDPNKGCVGTLVKITGSGWLEPNPCVIIDSSAITLVLTRVGRGVQSPVDLL